MKFRFIILAALLAILAAASSFAFSTGTPDGKIATLWRVPATFKRKRLMTFSLGNRPFSTRPRSSV